MATSKDKTIAPKASVCSFTDETKKQQYTFSYSRTRHLAGLMQDYRP